MAAATQIESRIIAIGNSSGVILPKEAMAEMKVERGDKIYFTRTPDGGFRMTPYDEEFAAQMEAAREIMRQNRDVLKRLAE